MEISGGWDGGVAGSMWGVVLWGEDGGDVGLECGTGVGAGGRGWSEGSMYLQYGVVNV